MPALVSGCNNVKEKHDYRLLRLTSLALSDFSSLSLVLHLEGITLVQVCFTGSIHPGTINYLEFKAKTIGKSQY